MANLLDQHDWLGRDIYEPSRLSAIALSESRPRHFGPTVTFELTATF